MPERRHAHAEDVALAWRSGADRVEAGRDGLEQRRRVVLDTTVGRDARLVRRLMKAIGDRTPARVVQRGARR